MTVSIVALGGGHGLSVTLRALRQLECEPIAIVGTGDDGGSSGRLRTHLGVPPPGDLRMALAALADEGLWTRVLQHRFGGSGDVEGHALGNLLLVALWEETGDLVAGLDRLGGVLGARGRVLPNCLEPVELIADVVTAEGAVREVRGQARLTASRGRIAALRLRPERPRACPEAVAAVYDASHIVVGPGSWFTSVLSHVLVPDLAVALREAQGKRILILNAGPQAGETEDFTAVRYLQTWTDLAGGITLDAVIADPRSVDDPQALTAAADRLGGDVLFESVLAGPGHHNTGSLAAALASVLGPLGWR
ncbi:MAG: uridine diphosphate-N-acetylglucosamine-binding protein YvcK [Actinobacteria bacterium]|nr:uridine diphosphate-N-acetylglucosamine-binding protein YvcK [Actinomycetota bacterium]